jgi:uncharacterized protein YcfJ
MPIILNSVQAAAVAATIQTVTVPVERVEPIIVNEPITVQVQHCHKVPVYLNQTRVAQNSQQPNALGGVIGAVIGGGLAKGEAKPYGAALGAIIGMQMTTPSDSHHYAQVQASVPAYYRQHCGSSFENQLIQKIKGYRASYRLDGVEHWIALDHRPGSHITVKVN